MSTLSARLANPAGTAAAWTSANPTLLAGEIGVESDTGKFKVGDGATAWTALAYSEGDVGAVDSVNGETGTVVLDAADVSADPAGTAASAVSTHEGAADPHSGAYVAPGDIDTLAELNTILTDATLDDSSDSRTPTAHAASHATGESDAISPASIGAQAAGNYVESTDVTDIVETTQAAYDALTPDADTLYIVVG